MLSRRRIKIKIKKVSLCIDILLKYNKNQKILILFIKRETTKIIKTKYDEKLRKYRKKHVLSEKSIYNFEKNTKINNNKLQNN